MVEDYRDSKSSSRGIVKGGRRATQKNGSGPTLADVEQLNLDRVAVGQKPWDSAAAVLDLYAQSYTQAAIQEWLANSGIPVSISTVQNLTARRTYRHLSRAPDEARLD